MNYLSLFSGVGGGDLGLQHLLNWKCKGYVEYESFCQKVLKQRIKDGLLDAAPIFGDIRAFIKEGYTKTYTGMVDVVAGGFPCQPFSVAGKERGADDERNMWPATLQTIQIIRPRYVYLENVPGLLSGGYFQEILCGLSESGYDAKWRMLSAEDVGAPHKRERLWIIAYSNCTGDNRYVDYSRISSFRTKKTNIRSTHWSQFKLDNCKMAPGKWSHEGYGINSRPLLLRDDNGMDHFMDRLKAIGNGQVPQVVAAAWQILTNQPE